MNKNLKQSDRHIPAWLIFAVPVPLTTAFFTYLTYENWSAWNCVNQNAENTIEECEAALARGYLRLSKTLDIRKRLAHFQVNNGQYTESEINLDIIINAGAAGFYDYYNRGVARSWNGNFDGAKLDFKTAHQMRPRDLGAFFDLIRTMIELKQFDDAQTVISEFEKNNPEQIQQHLLRAEIFYQLQRHEEAKEASERLLERDNMSAEAHHLLALSLEQLGEHDKAIVSYNKAVELQPDNKDFRYNRALYYLDSEDYEAAKIDFLKLLKMDRSPRNLNGLARTFLELNIPESALPLIAESESIDANNVQTSYIRGRYLVAVGKNEAARDLFLQVKEIDPTLAAADYWLGVSFYNLGSYSDALTSFQRTTKVWPKNSMVRVDIGDTLFELGKHDEALKFYDEAIALYAESAQAYSARARVHRARGKWDLVVADTSKSISLDEKNAQPFYDRAYARWQLKEYDEARLDYDRAQELAPGSISIAVERADFMYFSKDVEGARAVAKKLTAEGKSSVYLTRLNGRLAEYDGDFPTALKFYETARREDPNFLWIIEDIAWAQIADDRPALALMSCDEMVAKLPRAPESHRCRAKALMRMSNSEDALTALDKAILLGPDFYIAHLDKALALLDLQRYESAVEVLSSLIKKEFQLDTTHYYRGWAYESLRHDTLALNEYEAALALADADFAKIISRQLNRLKSKQPMGSLLQDELYPQFRFRR